VQFTVFGATRASLEFPTVLASFAGQLSKNQSFLAQSTAFRDVAERPILGGRGLSKSSAADDQRLSLFCLGREGARVV
jgi:hypothetical protein